MWGARARVSLSVSQLWVATTEVVVGSNASAAVRLSSLDLLAERVDEYAQDPTTTTSLQTTGTVINVVRHLLDVSHEYPDAQVASTANFTRALEALAARSRRFVTAG